MIVKALDKEWEVKPVNPKQQQELYAEFTSYYPEIKIPEGYSEGDEIPPV